MMLCFVYFEPIIEYLEISDYLLMYQPFIIINVLNFLVKYFILNSTSSVINITS